MVMAAPAEQQDLPMTAEFATAVAEYRDCVLAKLDRAALGEPDRMAANAVAACSRGHDAARDQLAADIRAANPGHSPARSAEFAASGMAMIDPMISGLALDRAREINAAHAAIEGLSTAPQGDMG